MRIEQFFLEGLGHQSYFVWDEESRVAVVIDPRRDVEIYLQAARKADVPITHVLETHVHNDYITGAREIANQTGATVVNAVSAELAYDHLPVRDGDRITTGALTFQAIATPGHTPDHLSYAAYDSGAAKPSAVFTGGSLLIGNAGRTDLVSPGMTLSLTRAQYHSLRRLLDTLPEDTQVYPTHGAGSFCGATMTDTNVRSSLIGRERLTNPAALAADEATFARQQIAGYGIYPAYYAYMGDINQRGPRILGGVPELAPIAPTVVSRRLEHGVPLIDGRSREAFAHEHVPGSLNIELGDTFGIYTAWLLPFNKPLMLLIESAADRHEAAAQLIRVGFEQAQGYLDGGVAGWKEAGFSTAAFTPVTLDELRERWSQPGQVSILDVRDEAEWRAGHIHGAQHIHVGDLMRRLHELPLNRPIATVCRSGFRAEVAASIIAATGREVIPIQRGGVPDWIARGYPATPATLSGADETSAVQPTLADGHVHA